MVDVPGLSGMGNINWGATINSTTQIVLYISGALVIFFVMFLIYRKIFLYKIKVEIRERQNGKDRYKFAKGKFVEDKIKHTQSFELYGAFRGKKVLADIDDSFVSDNRVHLFKDGLAYYPIRFSVNSPAMFEAVQSSDNNLYADAIDIAHNMSTKKKFDMITLLTTIGFLGTVAAIVFLMIYSVNEWKTVIPSLQADNKLMIDKMAVIASDLKAYEQMKMGIQPINNNAPGGSG